MSRSKLKRTSGGLVAVEDVPYKTLEKNILSYIATKPNACTKLEKLEDRVFDYCKFRYRGKNKKAMLERLWFCVDNMIEQGKLVQHFSKTMTMIRINPEKQE